MNETELALGTVQFGTAYGVAGRGAPVPEQEVRSILSHAWNAGIRLLDTAPVYGDIEPRLHALMGMHQFDVVSKVPALPGKCSPHEAAEFVASSVRASLRHLGDRLAILLFHRSRDLLGMAGEAAWSAAVAALGSSRVRIGTSCYSPKEAEELADRFPVTVIQLPGNALDQRLQVSTLADPHRQAEIHLRSVFLQGLLVMSYDDAIRRLPQAQPALHAWHSWCAERALSPLLAALCIARGIRNVRFCLVGVDSVSQLEQITSAWHQARPLSAHSLACTDLDVIDPRRWGVS